MYDALQLIGGLILAIGYIPQIAQLLKTRSCKDLNLKTYIAMTIGFGLMEIYAIDLVRNGSGVMFAITNTISLALVAAISTMIICLRLSRKEEKRFNHPACYRANDDPYPLCIGCGNSRCSNCCLYEDMPGPYDEI